MDYMFLSTNYFGLDGESLSTELTELRDIAETEIANAKGALECGSRPRAALHFLAAMKPADLLAQKVNRREIWEALAMLYLILENFKDLGATALTKNDFKGCAAEIYTMLFTKYHSRIYRTKLELLGILERDLLDYSIKRNLIERPLSDLSEIAISLQMYDILENDDGDIMIAIPTEPHGDEENAVLFCDGGEHALLFKGPYRVVICDFLNPKIREKLPQRKTVLCYELMGEYEGEYLAEVMEYNGTTEITNKLLEREKNHRK